MAAWWKALREAFSKAPHDKLQVGRKIGTDGRKERRTDGRTCESQYSTMGWREGYVMLSWSDWTENIRNRDIVWKIETRLEFNGYNVDSVRCSNFEVIARVVENAAVVLICMSREYKECSMSRRVCEYADIKEKAIIPLKMEDNFDPNGWLGLIVGTHDVFNFDGKESFGDVMARLMKKIDMKWPKIYQSQQGMVRPSQAKEQGDREATTGGRATGATPGRDAGATPGRDADRGSEVPTILLINDEYGTSKGGISTINCGVGQTLSKANAVVYSTALRVPPQDQEAADRDKVHLITPHQREGDNTKPSLDWLAFQFQSYYPKSKLPQHVDVIIGHADITDTAAKNIKCEYYKEADLIMFTHVLPEDTDHFKGVLKAVKASKKEDDMLGKVANAKAAFSVGQKIHKHFENKYRGQKAPKQHYLFLPRPSKMFGEASIKHGSGECEIVVLVFGRVYNVENLKGYNIAGRAMKIVANEVPDLRLVARGISKDKDEYEKSMTILEENLDSGVLKPTPRPYGTQSDILADMKTAHLVLMPSRSEPFGLVGLEAIAAGIPVLISDKSGLAEMIKKLVDDKKLPRGLRNRIVETSVQDSDMDKNAETWALKIRETLNDTETAFDNAKKFKDALLESKYWEDSERELLKACGITGPAAQAQSSE